MMRFLSAATLTAAVIGLAPLSMAQAAPAAAKPLPNPCATFKVPAAATLLGAGKHVHLTEKLTSAKHPFPSRTCTIRFGKKRLEVSVARQQGGTGSEEDCYPRRKLGFSAVICISLPKTPPFSTGQFHKDGIWVSNGINVMLNNTGVLRNRGKRMYAFMAPQIHAFKG